jgi:hypothetical protein
MGVKKYCVFGLGWKEKYLQIAKREERIFFCLVFRKGRKTLPRDGYPGHIPERCERVKVD